MAKSRHNWEEMEQKYVTGKLTYKELAREYKVSEHRVNVNGSNRSWQKKRKEYREGLCKQVIEETKKSTVLERSAFDELTTRVCDASAASMAARATKDFKAEDLTPAKAEAMLTVTCKAQEIKYRALGIPPPKTQAQVDAKEAFKHYQEKLAEAMARLSETGTVIKPSKGNGGLSLNPNDFIEVEIEEPAQGPSKN